MRKVFMFVMTSLDGYFEGENHDLSWHNTDEEFTRFANEQLDEADTLIFGRRTYELMASFWPTKEAVESEPDTASRMNTLKKIVFSHKPFNTSWTNTETATNPQETLATLKQQPGKDIAVFASSNLCLTLLQENLLDEVRVMVNPLVLGKGTPLFAGIDAMRTFALRETRAFANGNVLLCYNAAPLA